MCNSMELRGRPRKGRKNVILCQSKSAHAFNILDTIIYFFYRLSNVDERIVARGMPEMNILNNVSGCMNACTGKGVKLRCNETTMKKNHLAPKCLNIYK